MKNSLKLLTVFLTSFGLLAVCNDETIASAKPSTNVVTSTDGAYSITLNADFKDKMADKAKIASLRLPGTPVDKLTMLQLSGDEKTGEMVYGITMQFPAGVEIPPIDNFIKQMDEQAKKMPSVKSAQAKKIVGTDNQINYSMENDFGGITAYETCRMAITDKLLTVCITSQTSADKAAKLDGMIDSFQIK